jgi:hypothetical protein
MNTNMRHAGLFNFKTTVTEAEKQDFFAALKDLETILGVQKMEVSRQTSSKTKFQYGFSMEFGDEDIYGMYQIHPKHEAFVKNYWAKMVEDFMEMDTEQMIIATAKKAGATASIGTNNLPKETYFAGKWTVTLKATPEGDVPLLMTFQQKDGKWTGSYINQKTKEEAALKSVEVNGDKIVLALKYATYDMTAQLNRVDDEHCFGKMMDMIDCEGVRIKE